jgi:tetratricopeptide (TPR) repeat protein
VNDELSKIQQLFELERYEAVLERGIPLLLSKGSALDDTYDIIILSLHNLGRYNEAKQYCHSVLSEVGDHNRFHYLLALAHYGLDEYHKAKQQLSLVVQQDPFDADAHNLLAKIHLEKNRFGPSKAAIDQALSLEPHNLQFHITLARLYLQCDNPELAFAILDDVLVVDPHCSSALYLKAHYLKGRKERRYILQRLLAEHPLNRNYISSFQQWDRYHRAVIGVIFLYLTIVVLYYTQAYKVAIHSLEPYLIAGFYLVAIFTAQAKWINIGFIAVVLTTILFVDGGSSEWASLLGVAVLALIFHYIALPIHLLLLRLLRWLRPKEQSA